ncbi:hypothetical protein SBI67_27805 [Mycolicibacterium sp. 120266]|uniref:hypothetical protein n=1 Tax=Mycolicibacterium sp. 120266 TaxID=3090601 RepID=UPI00299F497B|nr:hypothetical protein [Mycolicibacterium sp. 120266]MDX1875940.1 hypothetical protein [Mycolicibacterium sp. 120266]
MSNFTEQIPGQLAAGINRLGDGKYTSYSIYPLPPDAAYDEDVHPTEWIQTTGIAPDRLTVEIKQRDAAGVHRLYTIGHPEAATETAETETIHNGDNEYHVRPAEVLTATEAIELFQHYYDTHTIPTGWHLREQPEFADTAVQEHLASQAATGADTTARGRAPVADKGSKEEKARQKPRRSE